MSEIVLVEDTAADAQRMQQLLIRVGVQNPVRWFDNGADAMRYLKSVTSIPRILLVDLKLPGMSGFEILHELRKIPEYDRSLRIVFSTLGDIIFIGEAYAQGAQTFLNKPVREVEFRDLIRTFPDPWILGDPGSAMGRRAQFARSEQ